MMKTRGEVNNYIDGENLSIITGYDGYDVYLQLLDLEDVSDEKLLTFLDWLEVDINKGQDLLRQSSFGFWYSIDNEELYYMTDIDNDHYILSLNDDLGIDLVDLEHFTSYADTLIICIDEESHKFLFLGDIVINVDDSDYVNEALDIVRGISDGYEIEGKSFYCYDSGWASLDGAHFMKIKNQEDLDQHPDYIFISRHTTNCCVVNIDIYLPNEK